MTARKLAAKMKTLVARIQISLGGIFMLTIFLNFIFFQELEIVIGDEHISFTTSKIGSLIDVNQSK